MPERPPYYPVALDLGGRPVLVVGGGPVGARKAAGLAACGAVVTVVSPEVHDDVEALVDRGEPGAPGSVTLERRPYRRGEAGGYRLVVTATGHDDVDGAVAADAEAAGTFVNSADDPTHCSFLLPAVHRDGAVTVAVSTGGASPALARWVRTRPAAGLGPGLGILADLLGEARQAVRAEGRSTESVDWERILDGPLPSLVAGGEIDEARALLRQETAG